MKISGIPRYMMLFLYLCLNTILSVHAQLKIYLATDDHTDYMWSADEGVYRQAFLDMLDYYIAMADSTMLTEPPQFQSRFTCDGSFWIWTYEKNRSAEQFQHLIDRIKSGHITVPLNPLTLCYGGMSAETLIRSMYYAGSIERRYDLRFPMTAPMENQTMPAGVVSLWAGSGAKYCWMGICDCATRVNSSQPRTYEIYWWTGPDGNRLLTKWNSLYYSESLPGYPNQRMGGYAEGRFPHEVIHFVATDSIFKKQYPYKIIGIFGKGWDNIKTESTEFIDVAKAESNSNQQVIVSDEVDFFKDFEKTYGSSLPSYFASSGNEWDTYATSMAALTGRTKDATEKLRSAEALSALVSLQDPAFMNGREESRERAFMAMGLYWNHDWVADGPVSKDDYERWARRKADEIDAYINPLYDDARARLGAMIRKSGQGEQVYAFNPLGWERSDVAEMPYPSTDPVHVIDLSTGQETPSQVININGKRHLCWYAENIPSVGYKVYEIRQGRGKSYPDAATYKDNILENEYYRLTVTGRGAITSLIDKKQGNSEFIRMINGKEFNDLGEGAGRIEIENAGPVSLTVRAISSEPLKHMSRITLYRHINRIDIDNRIVQNFESTGDDPPCWVFSLAMDEPDIWHEEVGAVLRARLLTDGGHYAPTHARYDWLTLNHFVNISGTNKSMTLSNQECCFMKTGNSTLNTLDTNTPQVSVLIGGQIDSPGYGILKQGGDTLFIQRFAVCTGQVFHQAESMRFALEHQNPVVTGVVSGGMAYPEKIFSLLDISGPDILLWSLKPAEDGITEAGLIVRVWNMQDKAADLDIHFKTGSFTDGKEITHIETPLRDATLTNNHLTGKLSPCQMMSYSVKPGLKVTIK